MSKVKAFTILEMLVNITIMSIIMGLIYFAYSSFVQQVISYQKSIEEQNELTRSYVQLKTDFYNAERVVQLYRRFKIVPYNASKEVQYNITDNYLIRKQLTVLDTLPIKKIDIESEKNEITNEELITKLVIKTTLFDEPIEFTLTKEYAPNLVLQL